MLPESAGLLLKQWQMTVVRSSHVRAVFSLIGSGERRLSEVVVSSSAAGDWSLKELKARLSVKRDLLRLDSFCWLPIGGRLWVRRVEMV